MAKKQSPVVAIEQRIEGDRASKSGAEQVLHEVTSQWLEDPKNPELIAQREALKQEVEYFDVKIARAQAELAGARAQDTAEARREQLARVEREFDEIVKRHARLAEVHQRIVEIFDSLAPVLAERDQLATDNQSGAWSVVRACEGSERTFEGLIRHLRHPEELVTREARAPAQDSRQGLPLRGRVLLGLLDVRW